MQTNRFSYRSLFWPVLLIGVGVVWLLGELNIIQPIAWASLLRLWPLLLIAVGLDMLAGRRSPVVSSLIALALVAFVIVFMALGPSLGWVRTSRVTHDTFTEPLNGATAARFEFETASFPVNIDALQGGTNLVVAEIDHLGNAHFNAGGGANRSITLDSSQTTGIDMLDLLTSSRDFKWDIAINPDVPAEMSINSGSGWVDARLTGLNITRLDLDSGSGAVTLHMPEVDGYLANLNTGSGALNVNVPCQVGEIHFDSGSGAVQVNIDPGCPVKVLVRESGSGAVSIASAYKRISGRMESKEGEWRSAAYQDDENALVIYADDLGSGVFDLN